MNLQKLVTFGLVLLVSFGGTFASTIKEEESARFLAKKGIIKTQKSIVEYKLDSTITRQEAMKIIAKLSGKNIDKKCEGIFEDVDKKGWGCKYIEFAFNNNLIAKNKYFRPNDLITKTESIKLILKVKGIEKIVKTSNWQQDYMETAFAKKIIEKKYYDFNSPALRGFIFTTATSVVEIEEKVKIIELKKISGEAK